LGNNSLYEQESLPTILRRVLVTPAIFLPPLDKIEPTSGQEDMLLVL